jgi:Holliday junction resolvasome RuvABC ATP-dependent DNA helicase subunit
VHGEVAGDVEGLLAGLLGAGALEGHRREVLRAKEVKLYADRYEITRFTKEDAEKLFYILDILPYGLNRIEWQILNILRKEGSCTLSMLAAKTGLSRTAIQRDHELYLIRKGFISIDNVRYITGNGCKVLESVKK